MYHVEGRDLHMVTTNPTMNGAVSSRPLSRVKTCVGVKGCLSGANVSQSAKATSATKPLTRVPMTFESLDGSVVVYTIPTSISVAEAMNSMAPT
jgi:hypothetical protein